MKALGLILAGGNSERLGELTRERATSAMPVGGSFRAIDFSLSNMSNSGVDKVAVITQYNGRSLQDHLSSSKWWDFGRKNGGLFVFSPYMSSINSLWSRGTAESIYQNISYLKRSNEQFVIITSGDCVYKMDYNDIIDYHIEKDADVTIVCRNMPDTDVRSFGVVNLDADDRVIEYEEKPIEPQSSTVSLGIYVISRTTLIKYLETIIPQGRFNLVNDIFIRYRKQLKIYGYNYDGYWRGIGSIDSYYQANMDFLKKDIRDLFLKTEPYIETKAKDEPPVKCNFNTVIKNSIVGSGSILNGNISNSVLFRRVYTGDNSETSDAIIMEGSYIGNRCVVKYAIIDKDVVLSDGKQVIGTPNNPVIIPKETVL